MKAIWEMFHYFGWTYWIVSCAVLIGLTIFAIILDKMR